MSELTYPKGKEIFSSPKNLKIRILQENENKFAVAINLGEKPMVKTEPDCRTFESALEKIEKILQGIVKGFYGTTSKDKEGYVLNCDWINWILAELRNNENNEACTFLRRDA